MCNDKYYNSFEFNSQVNIAVKKLMWDYLYHEDDEKAREESQIGFTTTLKNNGMKFYVQSIDMCPIHFYKKLYFLKKINSDQSMN